MRNIGAALLLVVLLAGLFIGTQYAVLRLFPGSFKHVVKQAQQELEATQRELVLEALEENETRTRELVLEALLGALDEESEEYSHEAVRAAARELVKQAIDEWQDEYVEAQQAEWEQELERVDVEIDPSTLTSEEFCEAAGFSWNAGACS